MRLLPVFPALLVALVGPLAASDLPTVKAALPDVATTQDHTLSTIDLRDYFEATDIHGQVVQFRTNLGTFNLEMLPAAAPLSVANFLNYVTTGRYANTFVHRSDKGLGVIQGGAYTMPPITAITTDPPIALEYNLPNARGTIAMARTAVLDSATSQWFVNTDDNSIDLGAANGGGYAVFGRVTGTGMSVVDAIAALPTYAFSSPFGQLPLQGYSGTGQPPNSTFVAINAAEAIPVFPNQAGQNSVVGFAVSNTNPSLVTPTVTGSVLSLVLAPGVSGIADLTVTATDSNGNTAADTFRVTVAAVPPDILVEQPPGTALTNGSAAIDFGNVSSGAASAAKAFTIRNAGLGSLTGISVSKSGTNAADFTVNSTATSATLAAGSSTTFTVTFAPSAAGSKSAVLHIASNDPAKNPFAINLTGLALLAGPLPNIAIEFPKGTPLPSGGTKNLGTAAVKKKLSATFTVHNTGTANLTGTAVAIGGPNASEFKVTGNVSGAIKPGSSKTFKVQFAPTSAGPKSALLTITSNDPDENPYLINLTGTAVASRDAERMMAKDYAAADGEAHQGAAGSSLPIMARNGKGSSQSLSNRPAPWRVPLLEAQTTAHDHGFGRLVPELSGTTWTLLMTSRVCIEGKGEEDGQGTLRITFHDDGSLWLEDDSGVGLSGTWTVDDEGAISAQVFPQSVEDYLRAALGAVAGLTVDVEATDLNICLTDEAGGPTIELTFHWQAQVTCSDPDAHLTVEQELTYDVAAD